MQIATESMERLARFTFLRLLQRRLHQAGTAMPEPGLPEPVNEQLWQAALEGSTWGMTSLGAGLVLAHLTLDLGAGSTNRLPAFQAVATDATRDELERARQLWRLRCQLLTALEADPRSGFEAVGALLQSVLAAAPPPARQRGAQLAQTGVTILDPGLAQAAAALESACPLLDEQGGDTYAAYLRQPLRQAAVVPGSAMAA